MCFGLKTGKWGVKPSPGAPNAPAAGKKQGKFWIIRRLEKEMKEASKMLEFEYAAVLRDQIIELRGGK